MDEATASAAPASNVTPESSGATTSVQGSQESAAKAETTSKDSSGKEKSVTQQIRELGEQDLDAVVKVKVNGQEKKVPLREAIRWAQVNESGYKKFQEASQIEKQARGLMELAKKDPDKFFEITGIDPDEYAETRLAKKLERMQMTPEQRELEELRQYKHQQAELEKQAKEREEHEKMTAEEQRQSQALRTELVEAWKTSGLPAHPYFGQVIAATMLQAKTQGHDLSAQEAAAKVKKDFSGHVREVISQMDAEAIQGLFGDEIMKKLRQHDVSKVTSSALKTQSSSPGPKPASKEQKKPLNEYEWSERFQKLGQS